MSKGIPSAEFQGAVIPVTNTREKKIIHQALLLGFVHIRAWPRGSPASASHPLCLIGHLHARASATLITRGTSVQNGGVSYSQVPSLCHRSRAARSRGAPPPGCRAAGASASRLA